MEMLLVYVHPSSHSQANKEDASLDPCEWKKNGDSEAIVHQGSVILVCGTLGNIFFRIFGHIATFKGGKGDFMTKHGPIHTRVNAHSKRNVIAQSQRVHWI